MNTSRRLTKKGLIVRDEKGTTVVELLVAMAISVIVFGVITTALVQFMLVTRWGNSQLQISNDLQIASIWLGRDALESSSFTPGAGSEYGTLNWPDSSYQFLYSYDPVEGTLVRQFIEDGVVQTTLSVARHITNQTDVVFSVSGKLLTVSITSTSGDETKYANLQFAMRAR